MTKKLMVSGLMVVVMGCLYGYFWKTLGLFLLSIDHCDRVFADFQNHYLPTGKIIFSAGLPSHDYFYSSFFSLFLGLISFFPEKEALSIWWWVQGVGAFLLLMLPWVYWRNEKKWIGEAYLLFFLMNVPMLNNWAWGQISIGITFLVLLAFVLYENGRTRLAAFWLALATAVKFYPVCFLWYFLGKGDWKFLKWFCVFGLLFGLILPSIVLGPSANWNFSVKIFQNYQEAHKNWMNEDTNAQFFPKAFARVFFGKETQDRLFFWLRLLGIMFVLLNGYLVWRGIQGAFGKDEWIWGFSFISLSLPFLLPTSWPHYFVFLPFIQAWILKEILREGAASPKFLECFLLGISIFLTSVFFFKLIDDWKVYYFYGYPMFSGIFLLFILYQRFGSNKKEGNA